MAGRNAITTDHGEIRRWVEAHGGHPAALVQARGTGGTGPLRIDFEQGPGGGLEAIGWDAWFAKFDRAGLAFLYEETTTGRQPGTFNRLVHRHDAPPSREPERARHHARRTH